jgi:pSer/pThr/pTyr-binding forkhead associated (FHA) protein
MGRAPEARLVWHRPDGSEVCFPLTEVVMVVGREEQADIRLEEPLVSRSHARIERRGDGYWLIDLSSTNHTRVNDEVVAQQQLRDGDEVRFARAVCRFSVVPAQEP